MIILLGDERVAGTETHKGLSKPTWLNSSALARKPRCSHLSSCAYHVSPPMAQRD